MRYLPVTETDRRAMLKTIGVSSVEELFRPVPKHLMYSGKFDLPRPHNEYDIMQSMGTIAAKNQTFSLDRMFAGAGLYSHYVPVIVDQLVSRGEFLTAYTPYQPEVSQGTLQTIYEFQTMMTRILDTGFCNASHYDGSTAAAEACLMALRINRDKKVVVGVGRLHPHTQRVIRTYFSHTPESVRFVNSLSDLGSGTDVAALLVQQPDFHGTMNDLTDIRKWCRSHGALFTTVTFNPTAFGAFAPPEDVDLIVGDAYALGSPANFGGPLLGFVGGKAEHARQAPGRLIGKTQDSRGRTVYTITLATREQHIRREKATSNICTNAGLILTRATIHLAMLGKTGFEKLSLSAHSHCSHFLEHARKEGFQATDTNTHYQEVCLKLPGDAAEFVERALSHGVLMGVPVSRFDTRPESKNLLLVALNETHHEDATDRWFDVAKKVQR